MNRFSLFRGFRVAFNAHTRARERAKASAGARTRAYIRFEFQAHMTHRKKAVRVTVSQPQCQRGSYVHSWKEQDDANIPFPVNPYIRFRKSGV